MSCSPTGRVVPTRPPISLPSRRARDRGATRTTSTRASVPAMRLANEQRAAQRQPPLPASVTAHTFRRTFITLMLEAGAPVPYVQDQVGHEDAKTTLEIYAQVLKRRDRRRHGEAFDALMTGAVPAGGVLLTPEVSHQSQAVPHGLLHGNG